MALIAKKGTIETQENIRSLRVETTSFADVFRILQEMAKWRPLKVAS